MKKPFFLILLVIACLSCEGSSDVVCPNKIQCDWADAEIGVLIHFEMPTFNDHVAVPDVSEFNPSSLNTDQWMDAAKKLGAKYAVLVAKHGTGFCLWPTEAHGYSVKNSPWKDGKGDLVADFVASCKKYGIKPGFYYNTNWNGYLKVRSGYVEKDGPVTQEEYTAIVEQQLRELWGRYGDLYEIWFDGGVLPPDKGGIRAHDLLQELQPKAIAFQGPYGYAHNVRWVGNEVGTAPDPCWATADSTTSSNGVVAVTGLNGRAEAPFWCPGEADFTLRYNSSYQGGWFWHEGQDSLIFSVDQLMKKYETSVGRNTNMLLGITPDNRGLLPDADVARMVELGEAIRAAYGTPLATTSGKGGELVLKLKKPAVVDRIILQENIRYGERVLVWHVEGTKPDGTTVRLTEGTCIGHKRIARFDATELTDLKLVVDDMKAKPIIRTFSAFEKQ